MTLNSLIPVVGQPSRSGASRRFSALLGLTALLGWAASAPAQITLTASDALGSSSFAPGYGVTNWSDHLAPHLDADYFTGANGLRTPGDSPAFIFQGHSLTVTNGGVLNYKGSTSAAITITNLYLGGGSIANGVGGTYPLYGNIFLTANSIFNPTSGRGVNVKAPISGAFAITNTGGTVILGASNTFSGGVQVLSGGTIQLGNNNALPQPTGSTPVITVASGGSLDLGGLGNLSSSGIISTGVVQIAGSGSGSVAGAGALSTGSGGFMNLGYNIININNVSLTGNASIGNNGGSGPTFSGGSDFIIGYTGLGLSGNGYTLTKIGANVVGLWQPAQTAPSAVQIQNGGILEVANNCLSNAPITLYSNAWLQSYYVNLTSSNNITVDTTGGQILNNLARYGSDYSDTYYGNVTMNGTLNLQCAEAYPVYTGWGALSMNGTISGSPTLLINVTNSYFTSIPSLDVVSLSGSNTFTGGITLGGGTLRLANNKALGAPAPGTVALTESSGAAVDVYGSHFAVTNIVILNGTGNGSNTWALMNSSGGDGIPYSLGTGNLNVQLGSDISIGAVNSFTLGKIDAQGHNIFKGGTGWLTLAQSAASAAANVYVNAGQLLIENGSAFGSTATIVLTNGTYWDTWDSNWQGITMPANIVVTNGGGAIHNTQGPYYARCNQDIYNGSVTLNGNLTLLVNNTLTGNGSGNGLAVGVTNYGSMTFNGPISGTNNLTIIGGLGAGSGGVISNTVTLTALNYYSGNTTVSNAVLKVSTSNQGGGSYNILDKSILDVAVNSGTPTLPASTLNLGVSTGCQLSFGRQAILPSAPVIWATNLNINGTVWVTPPISGYTGTGDYPLIKYGTLGGSTGFSGLVLNSISGRASGILSNNLANSSIDLIITNYAPDVWTGVNGQTWDIATTTNWTVAGIAAVFNTTDPVLFDDTASGFTVAPSTNVAPSSVTFNNRTNAYTLAQGAGNLTGGMALVKNGTNVLIVQSATNNFTGGTFINNGILQLGDRNYSYSAMSGALNDNGGNVYVNGGTLDVNGIQVPNYATYGPDGYQVYIAGSGYGGQGAIVNSTTANNGGYPDPGYITLTANATIGGAGDIDMFGGLNPTLSSQSTNYTLTKIGAGKFRMQRGTVTSTFGNLAVLGGWATYEGSVNGYGATNGTITVGNGAVFALANSKVPLNKQFVISNGAALTAWGGSTLTNDVISGPIYLPGGQITLSGNGQYYQLNISNTMSGPGSVWLQWQMSAAFEAPQTYTGNTTLAGSGYTPGNQYGTTLQLVGNGSLASPFIWLEGGASSNANGPAGGATLDATLRVDNTFTLASGQKLEADNLARVLGNLTVGSGAQLNLGGNATIVGALVSSNVTFAAGSTNYVKINTDSSQNDVLHVGGTVTYGGTLVVTNLATGTSLAVGNTFTLFPGATGYSGAFAAISPATPGTGLLWDTSQLTVSGTLGVMSAVSTTPTNITASVSGSTLTLSWPTDHIGWTLLQQTANLTTGVSSNPSDWTPVTGSTTTNLINITLDPSVPGAYFQLYYLP